VATPAAQGGGIERAVSERDSKRIIRQWNREIEDELRREAAAHPDGFPWKAVAWAALWAAWLLLLVAFVAQIKQLR